VDYLSELENRSIYIVREAYSQFRRVALLWSIGKDSTTLLWIVRKAFFGEVPFPVVHIDTGYKFQEIYSFRARYVREWNLDLIVSRNEQAIEGGMSKERGHFDCCNELKTEALKKTLAERRFKALLLAIRRDEHGIRAKERYFSPRDASFAWDYANQPAELWDYHGSAAGTGQHLRVHPMLHWTELDIWRYIKREKIPVVGLYFARNGRRYRSIGCEPCCAPVDSKARTIGRIVRELEETETAERSGRAQDKEDTYTMQKLRSLGYM
jgi:sulfate adenylyltransferase subunit 2